MKKKIPYIEINEKNAHHCLKCLATKFGGDSINFCVIYYRNDNPTLRVGIYDTNHDIFSPTLQTLNTLSILKLAKVEKHKKLIAGEREISLWNLSELYSGSAIEFKYETALTLEDYAFWTRTPVEVVEKIFCKEIIDALMKYVKYDSKWRIWTGFNYVEIDPWKFAIELDLN